MAQPDVVTKMVTLIALIEATNWNEIYFSDWKTYCKYTVQNAWWLEF